MKPCLHLSITVGSGLGLIGVCVALLREPTIVELAFGVAVLVLANAIEWQVHRDFMHRPLKIARRLYAAHSEAHHGAYRSGAMAIKEMRELQNVLLKPWALPAIVLAVSPASACLWMLGERNLGVMFALATAIYVLAYEVMHLVYHLPHRSRLLRALARHHALHHDPGHMRHGNFNVTFPLWDALRGTWLR